MKNDFLKKLQYPYQPKNKKELEYLLKLEDSGIVIGDEDFYFELTPKGQEIFDINNIPPEERMLETLMKTIRLTKLNEVESDYDKWKTREPEDDPRTPDDWYEDVKQYISSLYEQLTDDIDDSASLKKIKKDTIDYLYSFMEEQVIPFIKQNDFKLDEETEIARDSYQNVGQTDYIGVIDSGIVELISNKNPKIENLRASYKQMINDYRQEMGTYYEKGRKKQK